MSNTVEYRLNIFLNGLYLRAHKMNMEYFEAYTQVKDVKDSDAMKEILEPIVGIKVKLKQAITIISKTVQS